MEVGDVIVLSKYAGKSSGKDREYVIEKPLQTADIDYEIMAGHEATGDDLTGRDIIITFGGDGTVLDASKNVYDETPILTVKSSDDSIGALCKIYANEFGKHLEKIINDDFILENWDRAEGVINGEKHIALNEIYAGPRFGSGPGRYDILFSDLKENQRSSGVIVATGTGSTGWYENVEHSEGPFDKDSGILKFAVRDCNKKYFLKKGVIEKGMELEISSMYKFDGSIDFDGYYRKSINFPTGEIVKIRLSSHPLKVISFS